MEFDGECFDIKVILAACMMPGVWAWVLLPDCACKLAANWQQGERVKVMWVHISVRPARVVDQVQNSDSIKTLNIAKKGLRMLASRTDLAKDTLPIGWSALGGRELRAAAARRTAQYAAMPWQLSDAIENEAEVLSRTVRLERRAGVVIKICTSGTPVRSWQSYLVPEEAERRLLAACAAGQPVRRGRHVRPPSWVLAAEWLELEGAIEFRQP